MATAQKTHRYYSRSLRDDGRMATYCGRLLTPTEGTENCRRCDQLEAQWKYEAEIEYEASLRAQKKR